MSKSSLWRNLAALFCLLFGIALLLNTHPLADGSWFWDAVALRNGTRLYADMHLVLQPLFPLQTKWNMMIFGNGWLVTKIPAVLEMVAFLLGLRWISGYLPVREWQKALLLTCAFVLGTLFVAYRFDDYHVVADCMSVYSIILLLTRKPGHESTFNVLGRPILLGSLAGLAITTRVNDGLALLFTVAFIIWVSFPRKQLMFLSLLIGSATVTVLLVVSLTGDTFYDYATNSIFNAAGSKGGLSSVLKAPLLFPLKTGHQLLTNSAFLTSLFAVFFLTLCTHFLTSHHLSENKRASFARIGFGLLPLLLLTWFMFRLVWTGVPAVALSGVWMLVALALSALVVFRALQVTFGYRTRSTWSAAELLILIPVGQLLSTSMSSGGAFQGLYTPVGLFLIVLPISLPVIVQETWSRTALLVCLCVMIVSTLCFKVQVPYSWHSYVEPPMFTSRQWIHHPLYGPMFLETRPLQFVEAVCSAIKSDGAPPELLSLPYPYANYFCGVPPWKGYIQTFFDTVRASTISQLSDQLSGAPPRWILYQRQLGVIELHERIYHAGQPIPHRNLDTQIMAKLASGQWHSILEWNSESDPNKWNEWYDANWILIRTQ